MSQIEKSGKINVGGRDYAVGLFWQTAEDAKNARREANLAARQEAEPADLYCVRDGFVTQWGIGWSRAGQVAGMPSAAAALAESVAGNWLGVFEIEGGGWWFVAARRDALLPDGDAFYDNEDEPRARFEKEFGRGGWDRVFTPAYWGIGGDTTELIDLLGSVGATATLKSVGGISGSIIAKLRNPDTRKSSVLVVAALVVITALVAAVLLYTDLGKKFSNNIAKKIQGEEPIYTEVDDAPTPEEIMPWAFRLPADQWLASCYNAIDGVFFSLPGWRVSTAVCGENGGASVNYQRIDEYITISDTTATLASLGYEQIPNYGSNGNFLSLSGASFDATGTSASTLEDLMNHSEIRPYLWNLAQEGVSGANISINQAPIPQRTDDDSQQIFAKHAHVTLNVLNSPPQDWMQIFGDIPGLDMSGLSFNAETGNWIYSFDIYEKDRVLINAYNSIMASEDEEADDSTVDDGA